MPETTHWLFTPARSALMVGGLGVIVALALFAVLWNLETKDAAAQFRLDAQAAAHAIQQEIILDQHDLNAVQGLFFSSDQVSRQEFKTYYLTFQGSVKTPGLLAVAWAPCVPAPQRAAYELAARQEGLPDYQFTELNAAGALAPAGRRDEYYPVYYLEPSSGNEVVLGFDLGAGTGQLEALQHAGVTGRDALFTHFRLLPGDDLGGIFLLTHPVYREGRVEVGSGSQANLLGFVVGFYRLSEVMQKAVASLSDQGQDWYLFDEAAPSGEQLLYYSQGLSQPDRAAVSSSLSPDDLRTGLYHETRIDVLEGYAWVLISQPTSGYIADLRSGLPWITLATALAITFLLGFFIQKRQQTGAMLRESQAQYRLLAEKVSDLIWIYDLDEDRFRYISPSIQSLCGLAPEVVMRQNLEDTLASESLPTFQNSLPARLASFRQGQSKVYTDEIALIRQDGTTVWTETTIRFGKNPRNGHIEMYGVSRDISERIQTTLEIRKAQADLEQRVNDRTLELAQANLRLGRALADMEILYRVSRSLIELEGQNMILQGVVDLVAEVYCVDRVLLIVIDTEKRRILGLFKSGPGSADIPEINTDQLDLGLRGWVLRELKPAISPNGYLDPREGPAERQQRLETNSGAVLIVPLLYRDKTLGLFSIINRPEERDFTEHDAELLTGLAHQMATAIENGRLYEIMQQEIVERQRVEAALRKAHDEMEHRVFERTAELAEANASLRAEIIERKQIEQALQTSEARYRVIFEGANEGIAAVDCVSLCLDYANPAFCSLFGYDPKVIDQLMVAELFSVLTRSQTMDAFRAMMRGEQHMMVNVPCCRQDGSIFYANISGALALIDERQYLVCFMSDVTETKRVNELLTARVQLSEFADHHKVNELFPMIVNQAEALTNSQFGFFNLVSVDLESQPKQEDGLRNLPLVQQAGEPLRKCIIEQPEIWASLSGELRPRILNQFSGFVEQIGAQLDPMPVARMMLLPILRNGMLVATLGVCNKAIDYEPKDLDILEQFANTAWDIVLGKRAEESLRESEERYRQLVETTPDAIVVLIEDKIVYANQATALMVGIDTVQPLIGKMIFDLLQPEHLESGEMALSELRSLKEIRSEKNTPFIERKLTRFDGGWLDVEAGGVPILYRGQPAALLIVRDITERKKAEEALREAHAGLERRVVERTADLSRVNADLARAMRTKDEFLANMSHELRTPLNGILALSESLLEQVRGPLNERQYKSISSIEQSGRHLLSLINDILDLSKIEAGKIELLPELVIVSDICEASLVFVKEVAQKKRLHLSYLQADRNLTLYADPRRLKQILVNLLSNAVKFTQEEGLVTLEITPDVENGRLNFIVQDTGIGIPAVFIARLFQPFTQLDSSLSRQHEGTGLGLALVNRLVTLHGGTIDVESEGVVGKGTRFTVSLPWLPASEAEALTFDQEVFAQPDATRLLEQPFAPGEAIGSATSPAPKGIILLAEDNEVNILAVVDYLEILGHQVIVARNGVEALERAVETHPNLILMDIQMPDFDGLEATRILRSDPRFDRTPIIALTALAMPGDRDRCLAAGANDYMTKPYSLKKLKDLIERYLQLGQTPGG